MAAHYDDASNLIKVGNGEEGRDPNARQGDQEEQDDQEHGMVGCICGGLGHEDGHPVGHRHG